MGEGTSPELRVVGAAILEGGRCLAVQRSESMSAALAWEFPGGKIEAGERPEQALVREIREELALDIEVGSHLALGRSVEGGRQILLDVYRARRLAGELHLREHRAWRWLRRDELHTLAWATADLPAVEALFEGWEGS